MILLSCLVAFLWGALFIVSKLLLATIPPFTLLTLRFCIVAAMGLLFCPNPPLPFSKLIKMALIFTVLHLGCFFWALFIGLNASTAIIIQQIGVPFLILLDRYIYKTMLKNTEIIGITMAFTGLLFTIQSGNNIGSLWGIGLMILSGFFWSLYSLEIKKYDGISSLALIVWIGVTSIPIVILLSLLFEYDYLNTLPSLSWEHWAGIVYLGIGPSLVAHSLWAWLIHRYPINKTAPFLLLAPVIGVNGSFFLLHEPFTVTMLFGSGLVFLGLLIIYRYSQKYL